MYRRIAFIWLLASLLLLAAVSPRAAAPAPTWYVVTQGELAGSQVAALPGGRAQLPELSGGVTGVVRSLDGGRTWFYVAADGTHSPLRKVDEAPGYAREITDVVTGLARLLHGGADASPRSAARAGAARLARAATAWTTSASDPVEAHAADVLAGAAAELAQAASAGPDTAALAAVRAVLPRVRALAMTALLLPRDRAVTVTPGTVDFGSVAVGLSASASVTVKNATGATQSIAVNLSGLAPPFGGTSFVGGSLSRDDSGRIEVRFAPTAAGAFTGTLTVTNAQLPGGSVTVNVKGTGIAPVFEASPQPVDFGKIAVGDSKLIPFEVKNLSTAKAEITTSTELKKPFSRGALTDVNGTFNPGEKESLNITFSPKKPGLYFGSVTVHSSASGGDLTVPVKGEAVATLSADIRLLDFGDVKVGASATKELMVTNNSSSEKPLSIDPPTGPFSIGTVPKTVPAGKTVAIPVTFSPTKTGPATSGFAVSSGKKPDFVASVKGNGIENTSIHLSTTSVAFGMVPHGTGKSQSFTISNSSKVPFTVTLDRSDLPSTYFTMQTPLTFTVAAGGSFDVTIFFEANAKCTHKGKLIVKIGGQTFVINVSAAAD